MENEKDNLSLQIDTHKLKSADLNLNNYKILEDAYIDQGKTKRYLSSSHLFEVKDNTNLPLIFSPSLSPSSAAANQISHSEEDYKNYEKNLNEKLSNKLNKMNK